MMTVLLIGGTRFIGPQTVLAFLEAEAEVTVFTRGNHDSPITENDGVTKFRGDRKTRDDLASAKESIDPDIVIDMVAYHPEDVEVATEIFHDVDVYVLVSSVACYDWEWAFKREDGTPLKDCTPAQATDNSWETYGPRKAEAERVLARAVDGGVNGMSVRPSVVYGPDDYTGRLDYWIDRVINQDRILVPGDGTYLWHRTFVENVASAIQVVSTSGTPGEAYNVADGRPQSLDGLLGTLATIFETDISLVHASERELQGVGLELKDFPLYMGPPNVMATNKLERLGWKSTPLRESLKMTIEDFINSDRTLPDELPSRELESECIRKLGE